MMLFQKPSLADPWTVACSGGPDSMAVLHFLSQKHFVNAVYVNHRTDHAQEAQNHVMHWCAMNNIPVGVVAINDREQGDRSSPEQFWHNERYRIFKNMNRPVFTAHTLDDCVENWLMTSLTGNPVVIRSSNENVLRPFMTTTRKQIMDYLARHNVPYVIDPSNADWKYKRNYVRHVLMPAALEYNPGLYKVIRKKVIEEYKKDLNYNG